MKFLSLFFWLASAGLAIANSQPAQPVTQKSNFDFNANSKLPIVINSDTLEVFQDKSEAVFKGNVIADQGQMHLKSNIMNVFYSNSDDKAAQKANPNPSGKTSSIKRIEVYGNVFMTSPEETAKGDSGYYDTQKNFLELVGNVILTKDKNVLHGAKMDYDLNTGYSKLTPSPSVNNGRVRALFTPEGADGAPGQ